MSVPLKQPPKGVCVCFLKHFELITRLYFTTWLVPRKFYLGHELSKSKVTRSCWNHRIS